MPTKKTAATPAPGSLDAILNQPNNAATVERLDQVQQTTKEAEPQPKTLQEMAGGFQWAGKDYVTGLEFYGRKPKVGQLHRVAELANAVIPDDLPNEERIRAAVDKFAKLTAQFLFVPNGELWRPATPAEIMEAFDLDEMNALRDRFSGLRADQGNA